VAGRWGALVGDLWQDGVRAQRRGEDVAEEHCLCEGEGEGSEGDTDGRCAWTPRAPFSVLTKRICEE
jgi:hypothetical protein